MWKTVRNHFHNVWERYKSNQHLRGIVHILSCDPIGITLSVHMRGGGVETEHYRWSETTAIYAYKKDCWAVDQIRLYINLSDNTAGVLTENMRGWDTILKELPQHLSGCLDFDDWWPKVAFPPFEPNVTLIYQRHDDELK